MREECDRTAETRRTLEPISLPASVAEMIKFAEPHLGDADQHKAELARDVLGLARRLAFLAQQLEEAAARAGTAKRRERSAVLSCLRDPRGRADVENALRCASHASLEQLGSAASSLVSASLEAVADQIEAGEHIR